jgi:hypothetical protein
MSGVAVKASKADDAKINTWLWDKTMPRAFPQLADLSVNTVSKVNEALRCGLVQGWKSQIRLTESTGICTGRTTRKFARTQLPWLMLLRLVGMEPRLRTLLLAMAPRVQGLCSGRDPCLHERVLPVPRLHLDVFLSSGTVW